MNVGSSPRGRGPGKALRWALLLAGAFLAGLLAIGLALVLPGDEKNEDAATSAFSPPPPPAARSAPGPAASAAGGPRLAVVVDGLGYDPSGDAGWLEVPARITVSIIPFGPSSRKVASAAAARGFGVLIDVPMEPDASADGRTADFRMRREMTAGEMEVLLSRMAENLPEAKGAEGYMGLGFTADPEASARFAQALRNKGLLFLDGTLSPHSVVVDAAGQAGVRAIRADVMLDAGADPDALRRQWDAATALARDKGTAVVVCRARPEILRALAGLLPELRKLGITPATLPELAAPGPG